jgi:hypothetical protein
MKYHQNVISFMFVSGNSGADDVATGVFVEVSQLFDSVKHAPTGKKLLGPISNGN